MTKEMILINFKKFGFKTWWLERSQGFFLKLYLVTLFLTSPDQYSKGAQKSQIKFKKVFVKIMISVVFILIFCDLTS